MSEAAALIDRIVARRFDINSCEAAEAAAMLEYVDLARVEGERSGGVDGGRRLVDAAVHELSLARSLPVKTIQDAVCLARRVRSTLPEVWWAWHAGGLTSVAVGKIDAAARRLTRSESVAGLDDTVVDAAIGRTPGQLDGWLIRFVERVEADQARERHALAARDRRVRVSHIGDGMAAITAIVPSLSAAAIAARLDTAARALPADDPRTKAQARADLFTTLLLGRADTTTSGVRIVIGVTVPLSSLMGFSNTPAQLTDRSATIPASIIREAARQPGALLHRLVTDDIGNLLTASWLGRFAPAQLNQVLDYRDGTSVFPTSTVPARQCDIDHSNPWPAPTCAANTGPIHRRAHNLKTQGLISMRQPSPGSFEWTTRNGHTYTQRPEPLPTADWHDYPSGDPPEPVGTPDPLIHEWMLHAG